MTKSSHFITIFWAREGKPRLYLLPGSSSHSGLPEANSGQCSTLNHFSARKLTTSDIPICRPTFFSILDIILMQNVVLYKLYIVYTGCPQKTGISVQSSFKGVKWPQIKKLQKIDPLKIQFYQLGSLLVDCTL